MLSDPKQLTTDEIISRLQLDIYAAEQVQETEATDNADMYEYYRAQTMGNEQQGRSKIVSSDVFETVEWLIPPLMDIYSIENGTPSFEPVGPEDVDAAESMTELVRYQFWRQNDGESILRKAIKDCIMYRPGGIIKYGWEKDYKIASKKFEDLSEEELNFLSNHPEVSITGATETGFGYNVDATRKIVEFDGPRFYLIPQYEFLRHPNAKSLEDAQFVAHKKRVTADYLRRMGKSGFYENVEKAIDENQGGETKETYAEQGEMTEDGLSREEDQSGDPARREMDLYECYTQIDTDGDGILESRIITIVGRVILRNVDNPYERPPFVVLNSIEETHKFSGITITEMVKDIQRLRTFLLRQMVDNVAQANNSRKVFDPTKINQADLMMNLPGYPIRTKAGVSPRDAILELPTEPVNPVTFTILEYAVQLAEQRTGVTKSSKGVGDQYNETATGQLAAINQASQRIRMVAKIIASGLSPLFRAMVLMNKKFLTKDVSVRLSERDFLRISPDDLEGKMDLILNVVMGEQSRQQTIINMQQLLAILGQLQAAGMPVLDANNLPNILKETVKAMGYKNQDMFLPLIFQKTAEEGNEAMLQQMALTGGAGGNGGGNVSSTAGTNQGAIATTNPAGAGQQIAAGQPGAGGLVQGLGG